MARAYWCFYYSYEEAINKLSDEQKGRLLSALMAYAARGELPTENDISFAFHFIKTQIDGDNITYSEKVEKTKRSAQARWNANGCERIRTDANASKEKEKEKEKEKKKEKEKNINNTNIPTQSNTNNILMQETKQVCSCFSLPLVGGKEYGITQEQIDHWSELYPAVDVTQEIRKMIGWCESSPGNRKTQKGVVRFITGWLGRAQDRGGSSPSVLKKRDEPRGNFDVLMDMMKRGEFDDGTGNRQGNVDFVIDIP